MGMYTRLVLNVAIKDNSASVALLEAMLADEEKAKAIIGEDDRRCWFLRSSSYYPQMPPEIAAQILR